MGYQKPHRGSALALLVLLLASWAGPATADRLDERLTRTFPTQSPVYIGYERISGPNTAHDHRQYLILDFRFVNKPDHKHLQAAVARICHRVLRDRPLLRELDHQGYDEISVAFDRHYQYDCL